MLKVSREFIRVTIDIEYLYIRKNGILTPLIVNFNHVYPNINYLKLF